MSAAGGTNGSALGAAEMGSGYDPTFFGRLDRVEDRHFWFRARKRAVGTILRQIVADFPAGYRVLEPGCGNGGMLRLLRESCPGGRVFGMDLFREGLLHAKHRSNCPLVQADVLRPPFGEAFQLVGMFDVLEHIRQDERVLASVRSMLVPGGVLCITVPAHMSLWSYFDEAAHHARRYTFAELTDKLRTAGFAIEYQTEFMSWIYPLVWMGRRLNRRFRRRNGRHDIHEAREMTEAEFRVVPGINRFLDRALAGEADLIRHRRRISLGVSLLAVARRQN
jgi:SAM-dependent methyltransferase